MKVITGGQTGVDASALRAARAVGIETGGWACKGWLTESGPDPGLAGYGLRECETPGYPARTAANVRDADAVLLVGDPYTDGSTRMLREVIRCGGRPVLICSRVHEGKSVEVRLDARRSGAWPVHGADAHLAWMFLASNGVEVLMVAGPRESRYPGIGRAVERWLIRVFQLWRGERWAK